MDKPTDHTSIVSTDSFVLRAVVIAIIAAFVFAAMVTTTDSLWTRLKDIAQIGIFAVVAWQVVLWLRRH